MGEAAYFGFDCVLHTIPVTRVSDVVKWGRLYLIKLYLIKLTSSPPLPSASC